MRKKSLAVAAILAALTLQVSAWDYDGHRAINELALASLPANFGGFTLTPAMKERVAFLGGEADRWRNVGDLPLKHVNGPDHFIDLEDLKLCGLTPETLPLMRYDFVAAIARERAARPEKFPLIDPAKNADHTQELSGFLPWAITEYYSKLKSGFSCLKTYQKYDGTPEEVANAQANIVYVMGVMGHFVGDAAQPLHTTMHYNGWVGNNPRGYTTNRTIHAWIDFGYFRQTGGIDVTKLAGKIQPAERIKKAAAPDVIFRETVEYIVAQNKLVEPLYELEREGKLTGEGDRGLAGRALLDGQLVRAGQMLGNIWYTAWLEAPEDQYLRKQLQERNAGKSAAGK